VIEPMIGDVVFVIGSFGRVRGSVRGFHLNYEGLRSAIVEFPMGGKASVPVVLLEGCGDDHS
jgi:hypothetical protein